jgi:hypothetical protein
LANDDFSISTQGLQNNEEAGQKRPGGRRVLGSGTSAPRLHQKNLLKNKTLCVDKPTSGSRTEDLAKPISSEPAPSHRPWIGTLGATPERRVLPYHGGYEFNVPRASFFVLLEFGSCQNQPLRGKTTKTTGELQNGACKDSLRGML